MSEVKRRLEKLENKVDATAGDWKRKTDNSEEYRQAYREALSEGKNHIEAFEIAVKKAFRTKEAEQIFREFWMEVFNQLIAKKRAEKEGVSGEAQK